MDSRVPAKPGKREKSPLTSSFGNVVATSRVAVATSGNSTGISRNTASTSGNTASTSGNVTSSTVATYSATNGIGRGRGRGMGADLSQPRQPRSTTVPRAPAEDTAQDPIKSPQPIAEKSIGWTLKTHTGFQFQQEDFHSLNGSTVVSTQRDTRNPQIPRHHPAPPGFSSLPPQSFTTVQQQPLALGRGRGLYNPHLTMSALGMQTRPGNYGLSSHMGALNLDPQ